MRSDSSLRPLDWICAAALVAAVFVVYFPSWHGGFLLDDPLHVLNNPVLKPGGLAKIWVPGGYINYWPLTFTAYWLQYQFWNLQPTGYHLVNLALHALAALLVWRVLVQLRIPGALFAAGLFALSPVNVESIAWIAQLKGILSLVLALVSMTFYLSTERYPSRWRYGLAIAAFLLSALAKGTAVTLPVVLLACAWWQRGRIERRDVLRVLPYFVIGAAMASIEVWAQYSLVHEDVVRSDSLLSRAAVAGCALWFYLGKVLLPFHLSPIYPRWTINPSSVVSYLPGIAWVALLAWAWWRRDTWGRPVAMSILCYSALLLPVLGFVNISFMRYSLVADHWQYVATIVPCAMLAGAATVIGRRFLSRPEAIAIGAALLVTPALLTLRQSGIYADVVPFYEATIAQSPDCWLAENNLAAVLLDRGQLGLAIDHFERAIAIKPDYAEAHNNLAAAFLRRGQVDAAVEQFKQALAAKPDFADPHFGLGNVFDEQGHADEAIAEYQQALKINPAYAGAENNLGTALAHRGQVDSAIDHYEKALAIKPDYAEAHYNLANALLGLGRADAAIVHYEKALANKPDYVEAHTNLATALHRLGELDSAIAHYRKALEIKPDYAPARKNLAIVLREREQNRNK